MFPEGISLIINQVQQSKLMGSYASGYTNDTIQSTVLKLSPSESNQEDNINVTTRTGGIVVITNMVQGQGLFLSKQMDLGVMAIVLQGIDLPRTKKKPNGIEIIKNIT